jgi:hypothetical protein
VVPSELVESLKSLLPPFASDRRFGRGRRERRVELRFGAKRFRGSSELSPQPLEIARGRVCRRPGPRGILSACFLRVEIEMNRDELTKSFRALVSGVMGMRNVFEVVDSVGELSSSNGFELRRK